MDYLKILKGVRNLNDYITVTQELNHTYKNAKISLNMSTVVSLKNIRSLEIEYFNKCHDCGAAFNIFGRLLSLPPSKTWSLLGKELVSMLQYWLDAVRKHLISHHPHWWSFLKTLLKFVTELVKKEPSLNNTLVQELSDCLLDLATRGHTNVLQRHDILHAFNQYCAESSREIRLALGKDFDYYFKRLSTMMASCGHVPTQHSTLETLLRWLVPRCDPRLRQETAIRWFPDHLYSNSVRQVFLERKWMNFCLDARDLLNAHNESSSDVTSVICRTLSIGEKVIISGTERHPTWLDLNCGSGSLSILLDAKALGALNLTEFSAFESIIISNENTRAAKLYKESVQVMLSITTLEPPKLFPSCVNVLESCDVTAVISSRSHISGMNTALRTIFQDKYELLMDIEDVMMRSPEKFVTNNEDDTGFSRPAREGRLRSGNCAWSRNPASWKSPSTASTTSLAQLRDKLVALPDYRFNHEQVSVCAQRKLSRVTELSEPDDKQSFDNTNSTLKLGEYCVCHRNHSKKSQVKRDKKINKAKGATVKEDKQSDEEPTIKRKSKCDSEEGRKSKNNSEIVEESSNASLLFLATEGSVDESEINFNLKRQSTVYDYSSHNIIDLLEREVFQAKAVTEDDEKCPDSGINTGDGKKTQGLGETIENTSILDKSTALLKGNKDSNTIISKSTSTEESNTEAINDTPMCYVNVRKKNPQLQSVDKNLPTISEAPYDVQAVEDFFSQHFHENNRGDMIISPKLARKINETSSESSDFGDCLLRDEEVSMNQYEIPDIDVIECINYMVDKVCCDFKKYLEHEKCNIIKCSEDILTFVKETTPLRDIGKTEELSKDKALCKDSKQTEKRGLKLKYNLNTANKKSKSTKNILKSKNKLESEPAEVSSVFVNSDIHEEPKKPASPEKAANEMFKNYSSPKNKDFENRLARRKRKLYSPKDVGIVVNEHSEGNVDIPINNENNGPKESDNEHITKSELNKLKSVTPKFTATSYKDIEKDRQRIRRSRAKKVASSLSPKTRKLNDVFDHLKDNIDSNEKITVADKKVVDDEKALLIFNFTSDSEDEDLKKKKLDLQKKISTTTMNSGNSVISQRGRARKKVNNKEKDKASNDEMGKSVERKRGKRQNLKTKTTKVIKVYRPTDLADEKMRATATANEKALETSLVVEETKEAEAVEEPDPDILIPKIELVTDDEINTKKTNDTIKLNNKFKKNRRAAKKEKGNKIADLKVVKENDDDGTISPLPSLVVEPLTVVPNCEDSLTSNFVQKVKQMFKSGADGFANYTNTSQNLLSDNEHFNQSLKINITDEFNKINLDNIEDNASFNIKVNEIEKKKYSEILPATVIEIHNEDNELAVSDGKSVASSKNKPKKRNFSLKSSDKVNHSDIDTKNNLRLFKTTAKTKKKIKDKDRPLKQTDSEINSLNAHPQTEIICIDDISQTSNRLHSKVDETKEVITISEGVNSEISIATDGITAHGDLNEEPPSQKSLDQPLVPREITDMDESVLDYYVNLRKEIENSHCSISIETIDNSKGNLTENKFLSPVVSLKRISSDEMRKWTTPKSKIYEDLRRWSQKDSDSQNSKSTEKSLSVSLTRLSPKVIDKWTNNKTKPDESTKENNNSCSYNIVRSPVLNKSLNINKKNNDSNKRKSISPIKLFDDMIEITKRELRSKKLKENPSIEIPQSEKASTLNTKSLLRKFVNEVSSPDSKMSTSTRIEDSTPRIQKSLVKRGLPIKGNADIKRRKLEEETVGLTESAPSMSSIEDWFMTMEHNKARLLDASFGETMENIMERLDTTLSEIHQSTSKKFVHLFVDAQRHLGSLKTERREMCRRTGTNILTRVSQVIDEEFAELDRRSQEMEDSFMETLKQRATEFIRDDRKKKQAMVLLLQEDVQAATDYVNRKCHK